MTLKQEREIADAQSLINQSRHRLIMEDGLCPKCGEPLDVISGVGAEHRKCEFYYSVPKHLHRIRTREPESDNAFSDRFYLFLVLLAGLMGGLTGIGIGLFYFR